MAIELNGSQSMHFAFNGEERESEMLGRQRHNGQQQVNEVKFLRSIGICILCSDI